MTSAAELCVCVGGNGASMNVPVGLCVSVCCTQ